LKIKHSWRWVKRVIVAIISILVLVLVVEAINVGYKIMAMSKMTSSLILDHTPQIWAHRGFHQGVVANSMKAFQKAFELGVKGIELDVHYDSSLDKFVISHDKPYKRHGGKLLFLHVVFERLGKAGFYWLDLKNLSMSNIDAVAVRIKDLLEKHSLQDSVFIESWNGDELSLLSKQDLQTVYWIGLDHPPGTLKHLEELHKTRSVIIRSKFTAISGNYKTFQRYSPDILGDFPRFVFTINDPAVLKEFKQNPRVKVILTDHPEYY